jgi:hypothetical protein
VNGPRNALLGRHVSNRQFLIEKRSKVQWTISPSRPSGIFIHQEIAMI